MTDDETEMSVKEGLPQQVNVPNVYFNGFELNGSLSDLRCVLMLDGRPIMALNCSFTTGKTVAENFAATVSGIERATDNKIMNMDELKVAFEKVKKEKIGK